MDPVVLTHQDYEAVFLPSHGMNLISFKRAGIEVIDQATKEAFEKRSAGLGALIGPHFHRRKDDLLPKFENTAAFPQAAYCEAHGIKDLFSHGVARYVPWKWETTPKGLKAFLSGKEEWYGVTLAAIEAQNFQMGMNISLDSYGLHLALSVVSDSDSLVGLHYYYRLPNGRGRIKTRVKESQEVLLFALDSEIDQTFHPSPHPLKGDIELETEEFILKTTYVCASQENCFQLYHPEKASFVCIEPISAQDPRHPNLSVSSIDVHLRIEFDQV